MARGNVSWNDSPCRDGVSRHVRACCSVWWRGSISVMARLLWLTLLVDPMSLTATQAMECPTEECICLRSEVLCSDMVDEIPQFYYENTTYSVLDLSKNKLHRIRSRAFRDLAVTKIKMLRNGVKLTVSRKAFRGLEKVLETLYIRYSHLMSLPAGVFKKMRKLKDMDLTGNRLTRLPNGVFRGAKNLQKLYLTQNYIHELQAGAFMGLNNLKILRLGDNDINVLDANAFDGLNNLEQLVLADNQIRDLQPRTFQSVPKLQVLDLRANKIPALFPLMFAGTGKLDELKLANNPIIWMADNSFSDMGQLTELSLAKCSLSYLKANMFRGLGKLETLRLSENNLTSISDGLFTHLPSLAKLHLDKNSLRTLSPCVFEDVAKVKEVWLSDSKVVCNCDMRWSAQVAPRTVVRGKCWGPSRQQGHDINAKMNYDGCRRKGFKCPKVKRDETEENRTERKRRRKRVY